jgi:hypothetical protein
MPALACHKLPKAVLAQSLASPSESLRHALQAALCAGHMRAMHSVSQKRAMRHPLHILSLREAPQATQHTAVTSRLPASDARRSAAALSPRRAARIRWYTESIMCSSATAGAKRS